MKDAPIFCLNNSKTVLRKRNVLTVVNSLRMRKRQPDLIDHKTVSTKALLTASCTCGHRKDFIINKQFDYS